MSTNSWSSIAESLERAYSDEGLARQWKASIIKIGKDQKEKLKIADLPPTRAAQLTLHALGRGHALIKNAKEWDNPLVGSTTANNQIASMRGIIWRYVMSYCGWEQCTRSLGFTHKTQCSLLSDDYLLKPPTLSDAQEHNIRLWIPEFADEEDDAKSISMNEFLCLGNNYSQFPSFLLGQKTDLSTAQILSILRNIVVHGSLSASKAMQWNLTQLYLDGFNLLATSFEELLTRLADNLIIND